jgi:hypothetical protein
MTETRKLRVFLCHSSQDKPIVRELYQRLNAEGWIDPWLDEEKLLPGQDWDLEIEKAVEAADAVIVCLSSKSVTKEGYVQRELRFVLDIADYKPEETVFVIPMRLDDCPSPRRLRRWQYVDYFPDDEHRQRSYQRLQQSLKLRLGQKPSHDMAGAIDEGEMKVDSKNDFPLKNSMSSVKPTEGFVIRESNNVSASSVYKLSTISVETLGGVSTPIYYKDDPIPFKKNIVFSTATDNQDKVEVHLVLGENKLARDNLSLGKYSLDGIPPSQKGIPQIDIQIEINKDYNLSIIATEKSTGRVKRLGDVKLTSYSAPHVKDPLPPKLDNSLSGDEGAFSDFFHSVFGDTTRSSASRRSTQQEVDISFQEAYAGTTCQLQINGRKLAVRIPAGVKTGSKIRLAGVGPDGLDFYLIVSVRPHQFFTRVDADLYMQYPITEELAFRGGELQVPVLEKGKSIYIAIPPNTKDKQVFRFANRGMPNIKNPATSGDFYLTVDVYNPQKISQGHTRLLEDINNQMR